ncbi:MAG: acetate/propionate family kinase [Thermodesulfobacteriota bacterium]
MNLILTINSGSSSIKFSVYQMGQSESLILSGIIERIGLKPTILKIRDAQGKANLEDNLYLRNHDAAFKTLFQWLRKSSPVEKIDAVGHRIVHGGIEYSRPQDITRELMEKLNELVPLAPDHLPNEIAGIMAIKKAYRGLTQVACFDTAFHRQLPLRARMYPLPRSLFREGIMRYGFHGLSYEYIMQELMTVAGEKVARGRIIIAHLGSGASMAAVSDGKSMDTTMGFTPTGGLMMGTRSGDLDPGILIYLLDEKGLSPSSLNEMLNTYSGLLGVSGRGSDMKFLLDNEMKSSDISEAIYLFCYQAKKFLGALCTALGGLDTLIFTGGIGENSPVIRKRICDDMTFLNIYLDPIKNESNKPIISSDGVPTTIRVMKTNEELMIARHTNNIVINKSR